MNFSGRIKVRLAGRPAADVIRPELPARLFLPLEARRLSFSTVVVKDGQEVTRGTVLAVDSKKFGVPLLASSGGTVDLHSTPGHAVIATNPHASPGTADSAVSKFASHSGDDNIGGRISMLLRHGAWHFVLDAVTGDIADPTRSPSAVIVSTIKLDSFLARGDVRLRERLPSLKRGLEHIQSLVEYSPIYLAIPRLQTAFAAEIKSAVRGYAWLKIVEVPLQYPYDDLRLIARRVGLFAQPGGAPVWGISPEGIMAIDRALTDRQPVIERLVAVGGPGARKPCHLELPTGYPLAQIEADFVEKGPMRLVNGGMFTGRVFAEGARGVDLECEGITALPLPAGEEFLRFVKPGFSRSSYSRTFLSLIRPSFPERLQSAVNGEHRACINCGFCAELCPVHIRPFAIHKLVYAGLFDEVDRHRPGDCMDCGLCTYVCPSKIQLQADISRARLAVAESAADTGGVTP